MTEAERDMVKYLLTICGGDNCRECIHCDRPTCCQYVSSTDYSGKLDDDYCIDGMVKYFEQSEKVQKICRHCGKQVYYANSEHNISFYQGQSKGIGIEKVTLCPDCWAELFERRHKEEDKFYKECIYGKQADKKQRPCTQARRSIYRRKRSKSHVRHDF